MALILRGKHKGEKSGLHQASNDWIMLDNQTIANPLSLAFTPTEIEWLGEHADGMFWNLYELTDIDHPPYERRLKRKKPATDWLS